MLDMAKSEEEKSSEGERRQLLRRQFTLGLSEIQTPPPYAEREELLQSITPPPYVKFNAARRILWLSKTETGKWKV